MLRILGGLSGNLEERLRRLTPLAALTVVLALQFVPNAGELPWGGISMRLQGRDLPFADDRARDLAGGEGPAAEALEARLKDHLRYEHRGRSYPYMPDVDPYLFLRQAQTVLGRGELCDERRAGKCVDTHRLAPVGATQRENVLLPYALAGFHRVAELVAPGIPLMQSASYFPVIAVWLALVPAFFLGRRLGGTLAGAIAATVLALHTAFLQRTTWGHPDTDALNVLLPLLAAWLLLAAFDAAGPYRRALLAAGAGGVVGVFALAWDGWWYILYLLAAAGTVAVVLRPRARGYALFVFLVSSAAFVSVALDPRLFLRGAIAPLETLAGLGEAARPSLWPNVFLTVGELRPSRLDDVMNVFGPGLLAVAALGLVLSAVVPRRGRRDPTEAVLFGLWLAAALVVSTRGVRFTMFVVPPFAIGLGAAFGIGARELGLWSARRLKVPGLATTAALAAVAAMVLVVARVPARANAISRVDTYFVNDAWSNALTALKRSSPSNAIVTTWWDFGHHAALIADRPVTFDAASQDTPIAYWVGRLLLTDDERLSVGILRMLDCGSNRAFDEVDAVLHDTAASVLLLEQIVRLQRAQASGAAQRAGLPAARTQAVLRLTHCRPPQGFLILSDGIARISSAWGHFGAWDFVRAAVWRDLRHRPPEQARAELAGRYGIEDAEATKLYDEAQGLVDETAADAWIAPRPAYFGRPAPCAPAGATLVCTNGVVHEPRRGRTFVRGIAPAAVVEPDGRLRRSFGGDPRVGVALFGEGRLSKAVLAPPALAASVFTRLYYLRGRGLRAYRLVRVEPQPAADPVLVFAVRWPPLFTGSA